MNIQWQPKAAGAGKRFGLVKKQGSGIAAAKAEAAKKKPLAAFFSSGGDEEEEVVDVRKSTNLRLVAAEKARRQRELSAGVSKKAVEEDASIYDYDGVYDEMKEQQSKEMLARVGIKSGGQPGSDERKQPRYIGKLQQAAKVRDLEFDRAYERQLLKEQEDEKKEFGDVAGERYVTTAYKKQLQELRKWDAEDSRMEQSLEKQSTAANAGMHGFYSNLLTKNIGMGADVEKAAVSSYTHGSKKHAVMSVGAAETAPLKKEEDEEEDVKPSVPSREPNGISIFDMAKKESILIKEETEDGKHVVAPVDPEAEKLKRKEAVMSARERFLARKKNKT